MSKKQIKVLGAVSAAFLTNLFLAATSFGAPAGIQGGANTARGQDQVADLFGNSGIFTTVTNTLLFVIGAVSVIMIIIGGLRYVISGGNNEQVQQAKNTILYAVIGIIIAILAYAIVNFIIATFSVQGGASGLDI